MASPKAWWSLRRRPCFECGDERFTTFWPWVELLVSREIESVFLDCSDAFALQQECQVPCPYCTDPSLEDLYYL